MSPEARIWRQIGASTSASYRYALPKRNVGQSTTRLHVHAPGKGVATLTMSWCVMDVYLNVRCKTDSEVFF